MSEHITADLGSHSHDIEDFERLLYHVGDASAPLNRWRQLLQSVSPRGWSAVKEYAADVMKLIAQPRVLFTAAVALRASGPKAPGPNKLRLEWLTGEELWEMCTVLGKAIDSGIYRPGKERVHWVQKMSGSGKRPIVLSDVQDRVVQKAAALVLRSMLDPLFDPLSFAFRPLRRREQAIAVAEKLATGGCPVWLTHDLKDAFCRVPLSRLLDVVFKLLPCPRLRAFLGRILPPQSRRLRGIKQGGPLSPLMLELYLTHFLHLPWRKAGHDVRIVRYADDLLLAVADHEKAAAVDAALRKLLTPAGMLLKAKYEEAVQDIRTKPAQWLGFEFHLDNTQFQVRLGKHAFEKLARRFVLAHSKCRSTERAQQVLKSWASQLGPCYRWEDRESICTQAITLAHGYGFEETLDVPQLVEEWKAAKKRWQATRTEVRKEPGYMAEGPIPVPSPTLKVR